MTQGPIESPIINSPFVEPAQHFVTTADGTVTGEIEPRRRPSEFFVPVFMVFGEPDIDVPTTGDGWITVEIRGLDITTPRPVRSAQSRWTTSPPGSWTRTTTSMASLSAMPTSPAPTTRTTSSTARSGPTLAMKPGRP